MHHGTPPRGRRSRRGLIIALSVTLVVVLGAAAAVVFWPRSSGGGTAGPSTLTVTGSSVVDPPVQIDGPGLQAMTAQRGKNPTAAKVAARLAPALANPALGQFKGIVLDGATGNPLWRQAQGDLIQPASTLKLLTGAALLTSVDPSKRLTTKVVAGPEPGDIIMVGGGDVTLSAAPAGVTGVYPGAPTVADLAAQVQASGYEVKRILLDTTYWSGPELANGWSTADITGTPTVGKGFITNMQPLMVDGDRLDQGNLESRRSGLPARTAGTALARALGLPDIDVVPGAQATGDEQVLGQVQSQPVSILLSQALLNSDNVLAEALGREVAIAKQAPPTFDGMVAAIAQGLNDIGLDTTGLVMADASGLSTENRAPSTLLAEVMQLAVSGTIPNLAGMLSGLPVAGVSGTLAERFQTAGGRPAVGWARAKTGTVDVTYALVGYVPDVDGRVLVFALNTNGASGTPSRTAQDVVVAALRSCGCT
ncbi:D-alanyl-D-alanine carboxypeptidase/D-alanyl-D-alanine endopeptidase [Nakamurella alba]|nr:D-alanyl-D-alanine carboxypeptidase/D-alanyl-D-alanine-endopeptidase [Nakamurella alba]